jgi:hypothetical protein
MSTKPKNRREQIEQKAREFAKQNPAVGPLFDKFTFELIRRGYRHGGAKAVWERLRWESPVGADGRAAWKLPNNAATHYGRKFMKKYPEHRGFFRTRRLKSEDAPPRDQPEPTPNDVEEGEE